MSIHGRGTRVQVILKFNKLTVLYLHGNAISTLKTVDILAGLPSLRSLTLHGNEIEQDKKYVYYRLLLQ